MTLRSVKHVLLLMNHADRVGYSFKTRPLTLRGAPQEDTDPENGYISVNPQS